MQALFASSMAFPVLGFLAFGWARGFDRRAEDRGAGIVEYSAIGGLMLALIVAVMVVLNTAVTDLFGRISAFLVAIK